MKLGFKNIRKLMDELAFVCFAVRNDEIKSVHRLCPIPVEESECLVLGGTSNE